MQMHTPNTPGNSGTPETTPEVRLRLIEARTARGLSQQDLAERIGTTHVNVSRWERAITRPSPYFRRKLCTLFGKTEEELDLLPSPSEKAHGQQRGQQPTTSTTSPALGTSSPQTVQPEVLYDPAIPLLPAIPLVGRERELAEIRQYLLSVGNVALTALNGLPGVGKTALSITLAHDAQLRAHFSDGVLWAGLGPNPNMLGLLSRWGTLLGISATQMATLSSHEAWAKAIRTAIGSRKMLLVIDDAWTLEEALTFRVGGPNCAHLVTTRFPNIASHMSLGGATMIQELGEEESIQLLSLLAPQVVTREAQKAHDLVHAVGGLPLALTLLGNYLRKQAYSGPARRITTALERLSDAEVRLHISEPHVPVESHPSLPIETSLSLQSVIAVTDQLLDESARAALYALSIFPPKPSNFSEEAALAVAACTTDELDALSDAGMLESNGSDRYTLHQIIADYASLHLAEPAARAAQERLLAYITDYVETHKKDYELLELESGTILAALDIAYTLGKGPELVRAVCAFAPFLILRGFYPQAEHHLQRAHAAALTLPNHSATAEVLLYLGEVAQKQGNYVEAEARFKEGLDLARRLADEEQISTLLNHIGWLTLKRGELAQAEVYLQEALTLARQICNHERTSKILQILGSVYGGRGQYSQSEVYLKEGLSLARQVGDRQQICALLINLGVTTAEQGKQEQAKEYYQEGLILARQIGHREQLCVLLINLGDIVAEEGDYVQAESYFREGLELARQIGHREWISALLINLGKMTRKQGDVAQAEAYLQESLVLSRQIGRPHVIANALYEYGNIQLAQKDVENAEKAFDEMSSVIPEGDRELSALAHYGKAHAAKIRGNIQKAQELGLKSVTILEAINHRSAQEVRNWLGSLSG